MWEFQLGDCRRMDILILAHFTTMPKENGNNRFNYLADLLACNMEHNEVEIVTSSFSHTSKKQRNNS